MEMIERYIYAVTQKLPQSQREDIAEELRGLIEDMLDERAEGRDITYRDVEEVLLELGNPKHLARRYRGDRNYIIGPELFDSYVLVMKIVMTAVAIGIIATFVIKSIIDPISILDHFVEFIVSSVTAVPSAIGWTTLGFVLADYFGGVKAEDMQFDKKWKPSDLPAIPDTKRQIKRADPIAGIIFYVVAIMFFSFSNEFFGVWLFRDNFSGVVPFLNEETHGNYLPFIILILGIGILKECLKLVYGKWTSKLVVYTVAVNLVSLAAVILMITGSEFWNPSFMNELVESGVISEGSEAFDTVSKIWEHSTTWILIFLALSLLWDVIDSFIRSRKK